MEENKKNIIDSLPARSAFKAGIIIGLVVMLIVGLFIALGYSLKNKNGDSTGNNDNGNKVNTNTNQVADVNTQLTNFAKDLKLDTKKFQSCLSAQTHNAKIQGMMQDAQAAGAQGTPYSVILYAGQKIPVNGAYPLAELKKEIDSALNKTNPNATTSINLAPVTDQDWLFGDKNAALTIVEYSDIDCPFCKRFHTTMQQVISDYKGQVNWVYRHFPLTSLHPDAMLKANAVECVGEIGGNDKFLQYLDKLEKTQ